MPDADAPLDHHAAPAAEPIPEACDQPLHDRASGALRDRLRDRMREAVDRANVSGGTGVLPEAIASVAVGTVAGARGGLMDVARDTFALGGIAGSHLAGELAMRADRRGDHIDQAFDQRHGHQPLAVLAQDLAGDVVLRAPIIAAERLSGPAAGVLAENALLAGDAYADARAAGATHAQARRDGFEQIVDLITHRLHERSTPDIEQRSPADR